MEGKGELPDGAARSGWAWDRRALQPGRDRPGALECTVQGRQIQASLSQKPSREKWQRRDLNLGPGHAFIRLLF